jgi:acyl dehydratase
VVLLRIILLKTFGEVGNLGFRHFEDFAPGWTATVGEHKVTREEIVEFALKWDPQPFHTDPAGAKKFGFADVIACGCHLVAIAIRLLNSKEIKPNILAGFGWDELRFSNPVGPGDRLSLTVECLSTRESKSKKDTGIVRSRVVVSNQKGEQVLTFIDTILVAKRSRKEGAS